ncbi:MAG: hypothetical protein HXX13_13860 [Bacteroidetes bacterium]|nr:hypothetical protein [Bacteroidota bacterium]
MVFRILLKTLKFLLKTVGIFFGILLLIVAFNYLVTERYIFPNPKPFSGSYWYNPYQDLKETDWRLTNLHMHSRAWGGITNGSDNNENKIWEVYQNLGYESIGISNYQSINKLNSHEPYYIPVYEHGYGLFKNHQLVIGARKVLWYDLPFGQNIHHKQYILNRLHKTADMISINHPAFFKGYSPEDFKYLTGYELLEVLNGYRNSFAHWDSALSAGKPAFLMADDDMHDVSDATEPSRRLMMVNSPDNSRKNICASLLAGRTIGIEIIMPDSETFGSKSIRLSNLPKIKKFRIAGDTLELELNRTAMDIKFYGQNGKQLWSKGRISRAKYILRPADTYIRTEIIYSSTSNWNGITYYLNPVVRSADGKKPLMEAAIVDQRSTWTYRIVGFATVIFILLNILYLRKRTRRASRS